VQPQCDTAAPIVEPVGKLIGRLAELESDPQFLQLEHWINTPNLFQIVGKSDAERWHSAFWSWIMDTKGSHGLGDFAVRRFLLNAITDNGEVRCQIHAPISKTDGDSITDKPSKLSPVELFNLTVTDSFVAPGRQTDFTEIGPNMKKLIPVASKDRKYRKDHGFFDCLILLRCTGKHENGFQQKFVIAVVIEFKINASYDEFQLNDYSAWHLLRRPEIDNLNLNGVNCQTEAKQLLSGDLPVYSFGFFVAMGDKTKWAWNNPPEKLEPPWTSLSYNELIGQLLDPMKSLPGLSPRAKFMMESYIDHATNPEFGVASKHRASEQRIAADAIWQAHLPTFKIMNSILAEDTDNESEEGSISTRSSLNLLVKTGLLKVGSRVYHIPVKPRGQEEKLFKGEIIAELFKDGNGQYKFRWVSGGDFRIDEAQTPTGLLDTFYSNYGMINHSSGFVGWRVKEGLHSSKTLASLCKEAEAKRVNPKKESTTATEPAWSVEHRQVVDTFIDGHRQAIALIDGVCKFSKENLESLVEELSQASRTVRNYDKYTFDSASYGKNRLVQAVVKKYVKDKNPTWNDLIKAFPKKLQGSFGVVATLEQTQNFKDPRYFLKDDEIIKIGGDTRVAVCSQWGLGNIELFISHAKELGYEIKK
jgi:hypothetical protein